MKKFLFIACALIALAACTQEQMPEYKSFTMVEGNFKVPAEGGDVTVIFKTNMEVIPTPDTTWVTVKEAYQDSTVITVAPYDGFKTRTASIRYKTPKGGVLQLANINQEGVTVTITDKITFPGEDQKTFASEGGSATFTLTVKGADGYAVVPAEKDPWYSLTGTTLTATPNTTDAKRTGTINIIAPRTVNDTTQSVLKAIKFEQDGAALKHKRLIGWYSDDTDLWTKSFTAVSLTHADGYGMANAVAMDDDYVYLPKMTAGSAIGTIKLSDLSQGTANVSGMSDSLCFARVIKNTDASVNEGKDILLVSNVIRTNSEAKQLRLYAYKNGQAAAPTQIAGYWYDDSKNENDARRYGDRFTIDGTWDKATLYFPAYDAGKVVAITVAGGARKYVHQLRVPKAGESPKGIKDITVYPDSTSLMLSNTSIANILDKRVSLTGEPVSEYALRDTVHNAYGTYGYNFFSFKGKKYIAYAKIKGDKAWYEVIEDPEGDAGQFAAALRKPTVVFKKAIQAEEDDFTLGEHATGDIADCAVRVMEDKFYISALTRDGGFVLDEIDFK